MMNAYLEIAGAMLGISVTAALFILNIVSLFRGRRIFRPHRSCRVKF